MSSDTCIKVAGLGKRYEIFGQPSDRLVQLVSAPVARWLGREPRQRGRVAWALRDASFEVARGETVGIIGRNGSGKSTLLQMICGTLTPTEGTVNVRGRVAALLELGAGFNPEFSGRENIFLNGMLLGLTREQIEERFDEIAAFADIGEYIEEATKTYSSGMFVRLAFAVATSVDADVLIVDEALAVGDARFQARCMKRIRKIRDAGASVLFVSHDVSTVRTLCQRAIWLEAGRQKMAGPVLQVTSRYMESIFADDAEASVELALDEGIAMPVTDVAPLQTIVEVAAPIADSIGDLPLVATSVPAPEPDAPTHGASEPDAQPVSHWGEQKGLILGVDLLSGSEQTTELLRWGESCTVRILFLVPDDYDSDHFGVAFSIKNLSGSDIVVSSTHDQGMPLGDTLVAGQRAAVDFTFENGLVSGKYFLVVALERRIGPTIEYYEYLEGARYFSSLADQRFFGIYQPKIQHRVLEAANAQ